MEPFERRAFWYRGDTDYELSAVEFERRLPRFGAEFDYSADDDTVPKGCAVTFAINKSGERLKPDPLCVYRIDV